MKITNKSKVTQVFGGIEIAPGETYDTESKAETKEPVKKRGRPAKGKSQ